MSFVSDEVQLVPRPRSDGVERALVKLALEHMALSYGRAVPAEVIARRRVVAKAAVVLGKVAMP